MKNEEKSENKSPAEKHYTSPTSIMKSPVMMEVNVVVCSAIFGLPGTVAPRSEQ
jgi:hypothetical protein